MTESASTIEYENLEQKYVTLKRRYKRSVENNDTTLKENQSLKKKVQQLEQDYNYLEIQLRNAESNYKDNSESDASSSSPAHTQNGNENIALLLESKNQQLSELLLDVEETEKENATLRVKLNDTKNELEAATKELSALTTLLESKEAALGEKNEELEKHLRDIRNLHDKIDQYQEEKGQARMRFNDFAKEIGMKIDQWKVMLQKKNAEIDELRSKQKIEPLSESEVLPLNGAETKDYNLEYVKKLKTSLEQAEAQIARLKTEMSDCTREVTESARLIEMLKQQTDTDTKKLRVVMEEKAKLKEQLSKSHGRCRKLQSAVESSGKINEELESQLLEIQNKLQTKGQLDVADALRKVQKLTIQNILKDKKIVDLVEDINELQEGVRWQGATMGDANRGAGDGDFGVRRPISQKTDRTLEKTEKRAKQKEEENINLKLEILNLNKEVTKLKQTRGDTAQLKAVSEENEALRKGLHEILTSVRQKQETSPREIKSEVLERLLRVLDVKHVSGWYHPAMRLQAELHNLEGINSELREQLRQVRSQVDDLMQNQHRPQQNTADKITETDGFNEERDEDFLMQKILTDRHQCLDAIKVNILNIMMYLCETTDDPREQLEREFTHFRNHMLLLHDDCTKEHQRSKDELKQLKELKFDAEAEPVLENLDAAELREKLSLEKKKVENLIVENAKLEDEFVAFRLRMDGRQITATRAEVTLLRKLTQHHLRLTRTSTKPTVSTSSEKELEICLKKYRQLLKDVEIQENERLLELAIVSTSEENYRKENAALKEQLLRIPEELEAVIRDEKYSEVVTRLAAAEERGISERHRANHMTNLYDLVKEQLRKSEEKQTELSKLTDNLKQKNAILQEQVKNLQDERVNAIETERYQELRDSLEGLLSERTELLEENLALKEAAAAHVELSTWNDHKEQLLLDLKHEIVDLSASTEDKFLIHQLHCDLDRYKRAEKDWIAKMQALEKETSTWKLHISKIVSRADDAEGIYRRDHETAEKKIRLLQDIVRNLRLQYFGSLPLAVDEILAQKIAALNREKVKLFREGRELRKVKCDIADQKSNTDATINEETDLIRFLENRIESEIEKVAQLEHELLSTYKNIPLSELRATSGFKSKPLTSHLLFSESFMVSDDAASTPTRNNMFCQTEPLTPPPQSNWKDERDYLNNKIRQLENQTKEKNEQIIEKDSELNQVRRLFNEERCKTAALDQKVQDLQYENTRRKSEQTDKGAGDGQELLTGALNQQIVSLKAALTSTKENLCRRDADIIKYQNLLKEDRDKHSSAAANLQKELKCLQRALLVEQQKNQSLEQMESQKSSAIEKYVQQVHVLESHLAELHTRQAQADVQLHTAQQEASRWRQMAHDRLVAMEDLGKDLDEKHQQELSTYVKDYQKLIDMAKDGQAKNYPTTSSPTDPDVLKLFREKDDKIKELTSRLKQMEQDTDTTGIKTMGHQRIERPKEYENLKRKYDVVIQKNKSLEEEIKSMSEQLSRRQTLLQHRPGNSSKGQLQNKITQLQSELDQVKNELSQQQLLNDRHKLSAVDNFDKWKKQKYWQENCEKYKAKLQEHEGQLAKLQQTCSGYKLLIDRLEREKLTLESKLRASKSDQSKNASLAELVWLKEENSRLNDELSAVLQKFEGVQQGAGALGAAIMQEKLEAQERKITVLELSGKGSGEVRNEMERLHLCVSNLQKANLCLEAENLELKMDLEKHSKETPYLQEQIQHLESYIEVLKNESKLRDCDPTGEVVEDKKVSQLERTVFILKRVVEKLQVENKRLANGKSYCSERSSSADKFKKDYLRLKEQYAVSLQKIGQLQANLPQRDRKGNNNRCCQQLQTQLSQCRTELTRKNQLLDKVKALLHAAAEKERQLIEEIRTLKNEQIPQKRTPTNIPSPIEELSDETDTV